MKLNELFEMRKENLLNSFFGKENFKTTNKRFKIINHLLNEDEIIICTSNVTYWTKKDQFVLWVNNDKIVYLKNFQVLPVFNYEEIGSCYLVKLNKKFFKSYNCFKNEELFFDKEDTFDSLKEVAKSQDASNLWFKFGEDKYGNKVFY